MTKEEFDNIIADITNPNADWHLSKIRVINLCKQMCNKQKEICAIKAETMIERGMWDEYNIVNINTIINAPYPEELL